MIIRNREELLSHGNTVGRQAVLSILEAGLEASDPYENVRRLVRIEDGKLIVGGDGWVDPEGRKPLVFDLSKVGHIYVIGGGKAAQRQAEALEDVLGDLITDGHVNAKKGDTVRLKRIGVTLAGHPIPDEDSVEGARRIIEVARRARRGDIVFFSESGGGSALLTLPAPGVTLEDLQHLNRVLYFECGASMWDTNAVRNNLVVLRGREVRYVGDATFIQISTDERPPRIRVQATKRNYEKLYGAEAFRQSIEVLRSYGCWDRVSESIRRFLLAADPQYGPLTPEETARVHYYRVMGPEYMLAAARKRAEELGLNATIIASSLSDVEARSAGEVLAYMAQEAAVYNRPLVPPCAFLCGGELVVTVGNGQGIGGRNQEFVLATVPRIAGTNVVVASADSDGSDGPTNAAGAIADGMTMERAAALGIDVHEELRQHNSHPTFQRLGDAIYTGVRGTNVQDLRVVLVPEASG